MQIDLFLFILNCYKTYKSMSSNGENFHGSHIVSQIKSEGLPKPVVISVLKHLPPKITQSKTWSNWQKYIESIVDSVRRNPTENREWKSLICRHRCCN